MNTIEKTSALSGLARETRIPTLDIYRGAAIILVAMGHAIQSRVADFDNNFLFKAIYLFHMPLFFYICGMVYGVKPFILQGPHLGGAIGRRTKQLVLPFLTWFCIKYYVVGDALSFVDSLKLLYRNPDNGLWFLWVLFLASSLADIGKVIHTKWGISYWKILLFTFLLVFINNLKSHVLGASLLAIHLPLFFLGIYHRQLMVSLTKMTIPVVVAAAVAFPFTYLFWGRNQLFTVVLDLKKKYALPTSVFFYAGYLLAGLLINVLFALPAMVIFFALINLLIRTKSNFCESVKNTLAFIGVRTLEIYAIHFFFIGTRIVGNIYLDSVFASISAISLSIVIAEFVIKPIRPLSLILMGRTRSARLA